MSAPTVERREAAQLGELYNRYKGLALATGAALVLDAPSGELTRHAAALLGDCRAAARAPQVELRVQLDACVLAAEDLHDLLVRAGVDAGSVCDADTDRVRASHRRLRQEVWKVIPCEYVPCSVTHPHGHPHER